MTVTDSRNRPSVTARRGGYSAALVTNVLMLYLINGWPGWQAVPFLTDDTERILGWVNTSLVASMVVNLIYLGYDGGWLKRLGDMVMAAFGLAVSLRMWNVFPFTFDASGFDWQVVVRVLLIVAIVGSGIGVVSNAVALLFRLPRSRS